MRRILFGAAAIGLTLALTAPVFAGGKGGGGKGSSSSSKPASAGGSFKSGSTTPHFSKGFDYKGSYHNWSYHCYSSRYGCECYYCPSSCCWYYWDEPNCCYYPVTYLTVVESAPPLNVVATATATAYAVGAGGPIVKGPPPGP